MSQGVFRVATLHDLRSVIARSAIIVKVDGVAVPASDRDSQILAWLAAEARLASLTGLFPARSFH